MAYKKLKPIYVEWEDAVSSAGYYNSEDKLVECRTIGWLVKRSRKEIALVIEKFEDGDLRYTHRIPRKCVKRITYLEER